MDKQEIIEKIPEAGAILQFVLARHRKGVLNVIKVIGLSGTGKSYASLRIAELLSKEIDGEINITVANTVDNLLDLIRFIKKADKPGRIVIIEEAEVLFPSRRAMSGDNIDIIKIFDTIRKKKMIVILNYPLNKSIDGHIEALCNLQLETMSLNKSTGICILKPMILQTNPATGKTYLHRLKNNGNSVHRAYTLTPTEKLCNEYEAKKNKFIDELHNQLEARQMKKITVNNPAVTGLKPLTELQQQVYDLLKQGLTQTQIGEKLGKRQGQISEYVGFIRRKGYNIEKPLEKQVISGIL
jgi:hypothetical protein